MRKFLLFFALLLICSCSFGLVACGNDDTDQQVENGEIYGVYQTYITYAEENGETPLSYEQWFKSIKGEKGDKGDKGDTGLQGQSGKDGQNGINGQNGKSAYELAVENGYTGTLEQWLNEKQENLSFILNETKDGYIFAGRGTVSSRDIVIPDYYKGLPVVGMQFDSNFEDDTNIDSLVIGNNVTEIGDCSVPRIKKLVIGDKFTSKISLGFSRIEYIEVSSKNPFYYAENNCLIEKESKTLIKGTNNSIIPNGVTSIGEYAFSGCSSLTSVVIGDTVTSIDRAAFSYCSSLEKVNYNGTIDQWAMIEFSDYDSNPLTQAEHLYLLNKETNEYEEVTEVNLTTATKISAYAFSDCSSLTSVVIGDTVTSIDRAAFSDCSSLTSVTIGDSVTSIGEYAFSDCSSLISVTIGNSVTSIDECAFRNCSSLTSVVFNDTTTWYKTASEEDWQSKTGGTEIDVTNSSNNATDFIDIDSWYSWLYKI